MSHVSGYRPKVLVAEDTRVIRDVLRLNLEKAGFETVAVPDGQVALTTLRSENFDLLISDIQMPILDGIELCSQIRSDAQYMNLPIILISAKGFEIDRIKLAQQYDITDIVTKPFSPRALITLVKKTLQDMPIAS